MHELGHGAVQHAADSLPQPSDAADSLSQPSSAAGFAACHPGSGQPLPSIELTSRLQQSREVANAAARRSQWRLPTESLRVPASSLEVRKRNLSLHIVLQANRHGCMNACFALASVVSTQQSATQPCSTYLVVVMLLYVLCHCCLISCMRPVLKPFLLCACDTGTLIGTTRAFFPPVSGGQA